MAGSGQQAEEEPPSFLRPGDKEVWDDLKRNTQNAVEVQKQLLKTILEKNASTEYLQRHGINGRTDLESFRACLPVITFEDIRSDIERIADGETSSVLCADRIVAFLYTSGTGGKPKMIPQTAENALLPFKMFKRCDLFRNMAFPLKPGAKVLALNWAGSATLTKSGLPVGSATAIYYRSDAHKKRPKSVISPFPTALSPEEVILGENIREATYCHLLCGLKAYQKVEAISSIFLYRLTEAFRLLETWWQELAEDLRTGTVSVKQVSDADMRLAVEQFLAGRDAETAARVEEECGRGEWEGIALRLWPNAKYVQAIITGAMQPYVSKMQRYSGPLLPLVSAHYGASEGWIGSNLNPRNSPEETVFTLAADVAYLEFIPLFRSENNDIDAERNLQLDLRPAEPLAGEPVGIDSLQIGQEYEPVLTTRTGLYRYRLGDILKVVGFYDQAPKVKFICRRSATLSIGNERTDEAEIMKVVSIAAHHLQATNLELVDFTSVGDSTSQPGRYIIYWELNSSKSLPQEVLQKCCETLDQSLGRFYMGARVAKSIGPLKLRLVKEKTFEKLAEFTSSLVGGGSQYKTPRCITSQKLRDILDSQLLLELDSGDFPEQLLADWRPFARE